MSKATTLYCSFCGKSQHEVHKLIAGPASFICDECVDLCYDIIKEETALRSDTSLRKFNLFFKRETSLSKSEKFFKKQGGLNV